MKNCTPFEIKLTAYLHGELGTADVQALEAHLKTCAACRAELEVQRTTLELLGIALEAAPAPERLVARRRRPVPPARSARAGENFWFSLRLKALLASGVFFSILFFLSGMLVVFNVVNKEEKKFCPPKSVERPSMNLKKLQVSVKLDQQQDKDKPALRKRVVTVNGMGSADVEFQMPEVSGVRGGTGYLTENDSSLSEELSLGYAGAETVPVQTVDFEPAPAVSRPKMKLKKPMTKVKKNAKPKSYSRIVTKVQRANMPEIQLPEMSGVGDGYASGSGSVDGFDLVPDVKEVTLFGSSLSIAEPESAAEPMVVAAEVTTFSWESVKDTENEADLFGGFVQTDENLSVEDLFGDIEQMDDGLGMDDLFGDAMESQVAVEPLRDEQAWYELGKSKQAEFNPYVLAQENAFSTFSIDVDTASYGLARQQLQEGTMPIPEQVRTEEFINSFNYNYRPPTGRQTFAVHTEMAPSPFRTGMDLLKVGIKGRRIGRDDHRGAVLTLVIDTSGSMATPERLGLIKQSLALLLEAMNPEDKVAIAQFGGEARLVLEHTPVSQKEILLEAINMLQPGGPTQFDKGLELGYQLAMTGFSAGDSNRIMIMSDGVATLGELDPEVILEQVSEQRKKGIYLSVLGFGAGTYDDDMLERLANSGDGMYAYIDTIEESRRLLVDQLAATLHVIASDVKIQVEFNPARVLRYRQLGYENRQLTKEQFRDDSVDAGEVGSGQSVTALYDIELISGALEDEPIATVYVRYRRADNGAIEEISRRVSDRIRHKRFTDADARFQLAACTAEFAERLRRSPYADGTELKEIAAKLQPVLMELELDEQVEELSRLISKAALFE